MLLIHVLLRYTKLGKAMRATAADPDLARNCGIATDRVIDLAWAISGALCGLAGVILVMNVTAFTDTTGAVPDPDRGRRGARRDRPALWGHAGRPGHRDHQ